MECNSVHQESGGAESYLTAQAGVIPRQHGGGPTAKSWHIRYDRVHQPECVPRIPVHDVLTR